MDHHSISETSMFHKKFQKLPLNATHDWHSIVSQCTDFSKQARVKILQNDKISKCLQYTKKVKWVYISLSIQNYNFTKR